MVNNVYKEREDFLMNNPYDNERYANENEMKNEMYNILNKRSEFYDHSPDDFEQLSPFSGGKKWYKKMKSRGVISLPAKGYKVF